MIKKITNVFKEHLKKGKLPVILGILGIVLIGFSSFTPFTSKKTAETKNIGYTDCEEYRLQLEKQIKNAVVSITGDKDACVVVTLETGVRYTYASETEKNTNDVKDEKKTDTASAVKTKHITVKTESGGEEALLLSEHMPQVRGVAIVCKYANNQEVCQNIINTVTAALGITSKRVYVTAPVN